ncbi:MAG: DUF3592 domain-containing protein [Bdellovibrionales bacterium]|nr:DUF3592 domain-containing protein [Bdellovibrionales bacterium]
MSTEKEIQDLAFRKRVEQVLLAPVLAATLLVLPYLIFVQISRGLKSTAWPKAPGRVISSEVVIKYADEDTQVQENGQQLKVNPSYRPVVLYEYWVKGRRFESDNLAYIQDGQGREWADEKTRLYKPGKRIIVRYDPLDPENAVLEAGASQKGILSATLAFMMFEILLTFVSAVFLWDIYRLNYLINHRKLTRPPEPRENSKAA